MARKKQPKKTPNQIEFAKQKARIMRTVRNMQKRGYQVDTTFIPTKKSRVSKKSIAEMQSIKPKNLYEHAKFVNKETGEIIPGSQQRRNERVVAAKKGAFNRRMKKLVGQEVTKAMKEKNKPFHMPSQSKITIMNFRAMLSDFPAMAKPLLTRWLDKLIEERGESAVAEMLNEGMADGNMINYQVAYHTELLMQYMSDMLEYLPEITTEEKAELTEYFEYDEVWETYQ